MSSALKSHCGQDISDLSSRERVATTGVGVPKSKIKRPARKVVGAAPHHDFLAVRLTCQSGTV
jgi:hypothetical protein